MEDHDLDEQITVRINSKILRIFKENLRPNVTLSLRIRQLIEQDLRQRYLIN